MFTENVMIQKNKWNPSTQHTSSPISSPYPRNPSTTTTTFLTHLTLNPLRAQPPHVRYLKKFSSPLGNAKLISKDLRD